jgi:hypothetical protein
MGRRFWRARRAGGWWWISVSKKFFFVKKNQKTFIRWAGPVQRGRVQQMKVFCFFSSEKKCYAFFTFQNNTDPARTPEIFLV